MPAVDVKAERGINARSSTNWCAGTSIARSWATLPSIVTSPRTLTGCPQARSIGPGAPSEAVSCPRRCFHSSPHTFRFTSTTSS